MKCLKIHTLEKGLCDSDVLLLHAAFQVFVDFMEKEKPGKVFDWNSDQAHRNVWKEIQYLYKWWTKIRPKRKYPLEDDNLEIPPFKSKRKHDGLIEWIKPDKKKYAKYYAAMKKEMALDEKWRKEDDANLQRLINIKDHLWT